MLLDNDLSWSESSEIELCSSDDEPLIKPKQQSSLFKKKKTFKTLWQENTQNTVKKVYDRRDIIRGPRIAWLYFLHENRKKGESYAKLCQTLSIVWKTMNENDKLKYYEKEANDLARYKREESLLNSRDRQILKRIRKKRKLDRPENYPKRPLSAYQLFVKEQRPKIKENNPAFTFEQIGKELGKQWKEIESNLKESYDKIAIQESERYKQEKEKYVIEFGTIPKDSIYTCKNAKEIRNKKVPM